jgi:phosphate acetyltransferase
MSPVVIPPGYTRKFLDGEITLESQLRKIRQSFERITAQNDYTIVEGTGHTGVGSIVDVNNARVAAELGIDMILIANGGIGSAFDDLALNYSLCREYGVRVRGVILNKVRPDKLEMVREYFPKALEKWDIPLIGVVPNLSVLENCSMLDFEGLFKKPMLSGRERRFHQYTKTSLVTSGLRRFLVKLSSNEYNDTLFVTHASRNDIILGYLSHGQNYEARTGEKFNGGLILTGVPPVDQPQPYIMDIIKSANLPVLYAPVTTFEAMEKITRFTGERHDMGPWFGERLGTQSTHHVFPGFSSNSVAKFNPTDRQKVLRCGEHYAQYIDFDVVLDR